MLFAEQVNVLWLVQVLRAIGGSLEGRSHFSVVTFVFVILGLLDVEPLRRHLRRLGDGTVGATAIDAVAEIAARLQTYMLVRLRQVSSLPPDRSPALGGHHDTGEGRSVTDARPRSGSSASAQPTTG